LERISKQDMDFLIKQNIIRIYKNGEFKGTYGDSLIVTGKQGTKNKKQRYVSPTIYNKLQELLGKQVNNIENVKDNQRYMFT